MGLTRGKQLFAHLVYLYVVNNNKKAVQQTLVSKETRSKWNHGQYCLVQSIFNQLFSTELNSNGYSNN